MKHFYPRGVSRNCLAFVSKLVLLKDRFAAGHVVATEGSQHILEVLGTTEDTAAQSSQFCGFCGVETESGAGNGRLIASQGSLCCSAPGQDPASGLVICSLYTAPDLASLHVYV